MTKTKTLLLVLAGIGAFALALAAIQLARLQRHKAPANNKEQAKTEEPESLTPPAVYFTIEELGIKFKIDRTLADELEYYFDSWINKQDGKQVEGIYFSSKSLARVGKYCSPEHGPLGSITRISGQAPQSECCGSLNIRQFDGWYIAYSGPQAACWDGDNNTAEGLSQKQRTMLVKALRTIELAN